MKRTSTVAVSLVLVAIAACSGSSTPRTPSTTQPTPTSSACTFAISPSTANFGAGGGPQVVNVTATPSGCAPSAWSASTASAALSVTPTSGSGNGSVTVTASANTTTAQQNLIATIAGQPFTATVSPTNCTYVFSANAPDQNGNVWVVPADASQRGVTVTVTPNDGSCAPWKASSNADWIAVSPKSGTTNTTVRVDYAANDTTASRTGNVSFQRPGCNGVDCDVTVGLNQSGRAMVTLVTLRVTLVQGENLSGPYGGTVTGPNGFSCSLPQSSSSVTCPPMVFPTGSAVPLVVTLIPNPWGDKAIWSAKGCDNVGPPGNPETCTVNLMSDRDVTIGVGCSTCSPVVEMTDSLIENPRS